jgi:hypothetical protein
MRQDAANPTRVADAVRADDPKWLLRSKFCEIGEYTPARQKIGLRRAKQGRRSGQRP